MDLTAETKLAERVTSSPGGRRRYAVKAAWRTLQGEGAWAGRPAVFVRFSGCNLWSGHDADRRRDAERHGAHCPLWCDTDFTKEGAARLDAEDLVAEVDRISSGSVDFVVMTGGEPLLQTDAALMQKLQAAGYEVACETNGTIRIEDAFRSETGTQPPDWIVCSPKLPEERLAIEYCDELKLVVPDYLPDQYRSLTSRVRRHHVGGRERRYLWLQPEDGPRLKEATRLAVETAQATSGWRVSVQTHKVLGID